MPTYGAVHDFQNQAQGAFVVVYGYVLWPLVVNAAATHAVFSQTDESSSPAERVAPAFVVHAAMMRAGFSQTDESSSPAQRVCLAS